MPPNEWKRQLQSDHGLTNSDADIAVQHMLWHQHVDVDLSRVNFDGVPRSGGRRLRDAIRAELRGYKQHGLIPGMSLSPLSEDALLTEPHLILYVNQQIDLLQFSFPLLQDAAQAEPTS